MPDSLSGHNSHRNGYKTIRSPFKRPDAVLFDWDDTLSRHRSISIGIMGELMDNIGTQSVPPASPVKLLKAWYESVNNCCTTYFPGHDVAEIRQLYREKLNAMPVEDTQLFQETKDILSSLKEKGVPMGIVSNKSQQRLEEEVAYHELTGFFDAIVGHVEEKKTKLKPDPQPVTRALKEMGVPLGNIWLVGDSLEDAGAGRSDGIRRFHIGNFLRDLVHSRTEGPIKTLDDLAEFKADYVDLIPAKGSLVIR